MQRVKRIGVLMTASGWGCGVACGQPAEMLGGSPRVEIAEVLATGVFVPGIGTMRTLGNFEVSDACWLGVRVSAQEPGGDNVREVLATGPAGLALVPVVIGGGTIPGTTFTTPRLEAFSQFRMARRGQVSYVANFVDSGVTGTGLFYQQAQAAPARLLARNQRTAPGMPPTVLYQGLSGSPVMEPGGVMTFVGALSGPNITSANDRAVYSTSGGPATLLFTEGTPISSLGDRSITFLNDLNATGVAFGPSRVFTATLGTPGMPTVLAGMPLTQVATMNNSLPGDPGARFVEFSPGPGVGQGFEVAFAATLAGAAVDATNNWAIATNTGQTLVRAGQSAAGLPQTTRYQRLSTPVLYSGANRVLFHASLQGPDVTDLNRSALFAGERGSIGLIVRSGSQAPGCPPGVVIGLFSDRLNTDPVYVNARGDIVFQSQLRGEGVTLANDKALFAYSQRHGLQLIVREGDTLRLAGAVRTVGTILLPERTGSVTQTNGKDGRRTILNPHGECFFGVRSTDGIEALLKAQVNLPPCPADFNEDRFVDCFDYDAFVAAFEAGEPEADQDEDGFIDGFDYEAFVLAFETDC